LKNILQVHLFNRIWKSGNEAAKIWDNIDQSKLKEGITEFIQALHFNKYESQKKMIEEISTTEQTTDVNIPLNEKKIQFPILCSVWNPYGEKLHPFCSSQCVYFESDSSWYGFTHLSSS
jgi:hypothetical protein